MSPLPGWIAGAQNVCLNFSNNDVALQLHHALFNGSGGYVLKPWKMRTSTEGHDDDYWPTACDSLQRVTLGVFSLHNCPKRNEQRPHYSGHRERSHEYIPELSGTAVAPDKRDPSSPALNVSLRAIGGVCAVSNKLPLPQQNVNTELFLPASRGGINVGFDGKVHCFASEPDATFLRVAVIDRGKVDAYETAVLGRLRSGFRIFRLRSGLGTRIELCHLFIHISAGSETNLFASPREVRMIRASRQLKI